MDYPTFFGYASGLLEGLGALPYLYAILTHKTQPSRTTWLIWSVVGIVLLASYYFSGARETLWQPAVAVLFNLTFAVLSFKYGTGGTSKLDIFCFVGSAISLFFWFYTKNPVVGMTIIVFVAFLGSIPTILKVYKNPESEDKITWLIWMLAAIFNLFAVKSWTFGIIFYPAEAALAAVSIYFLIVRKDLFKKTKLFFKISA